MTGNIRDTNRGIESGQAVRDGRGGRLAYGAGRVTSGSETHYRFVGVIHGFSVFGLGTSTEPVRVNEATLSILSVVLNETVTVTATVEKRGQLTREETIECN